MSQTTAQEPMQSIAVEQVDEDTSGGRKIRTLTGKETKESKNKIPFQVGNTPLIKLGRICPTGNVFGKAEFSNPTGSVKDRAAFWMLKEAIEKENLSLGNRELLDSSSGNTGISLAAFGASIGLGVTIVLPQNASQERKRMLKLFGAKTVYSDPLEGSDGAMRLARELAEKYSDRYVYLDQYSNDANWRAHYYGTAKEIWAQTGGKVTHFVSGVGTGGTIMGTGKRLKELKPSIKVVAVEPSSPFHGIEGLKHIESSIKPKIFDENFPDETILIDTEQAQAMMLKLAREQGVLVGTSSGATVAVAKKLAEQQVDEKARGSREQEGEQAKSLIVAVLADAGTRYLSEKYIQDALR
jgi:cysteine synthase B